MVSRLKYIRLSDVTSRLEVGQSLLYSMFSIIPCNRSLRILLESEKSFGMFVARDKCGNHANAFQVHPKDAHHS